MDTFNQKFSEYYEYFENIRKRIYSVAVVFVAFFLIGFFKTGFILKTIVTAFNLREASIVTTSPFQFLDLATKIGMYTGVLFCLPLIIYHTYDFLKDGLSKKERSLFFVLLPVAILLFITGVLYMLAILYIYLNSVSGINLSFGLSNVWDVSSFLSQVILASAFLGTIFQYPIVLTFLIKGKFITVESLRRNRLYAIVSMFLFVGLLPPPDIFSTFFQALPLVIIYEITIWANKGYSLGATHTKLIETTT